MATPLTFTTIQMPSPGEVAAHQLGSNLMLLVENSVGVDDDSVYSPYLTYEAVDIRGGTRVHAATVTNHRRRSVVSRWTLCSAKHSRFRVIHRRRDEDLDTTVTCSRCRRRLQKAGLL